MRAKEYLEQIEKLTIKIKQREEQLACLRETAGGAAAIRYDKESVQVSVTPDIVERNVIRLVTLEEQIFTEKVRMESLKNQIIEQIQAIDDKRYMEILYLKYVKFERYYEIAERMKYEYDYVRCLHGEALGYFEKKYEDSIFQMQSPHKISQ